MPGALGRLLFAGEEQRAGGRGGHLRVDCGPTVYRCSLGQAHEQADRRAGAVSCKASIWPLLREKAPDSLIHGFARHAGADEEHQHIGCRVAIVRHAGVVTPAAAQLLMGQQRFDGATRVKVVTGIEKCICDITRWPVDRTPCKRFEIVPAALLCLEINEETDGWRQIQLPPDPGGVGSTKFTESARPRVTVGELFHDPPSVQRSNTWPVL